MNKFKKGDIFTDSYNPGFIYLVLYIKEFYTLGRLFDYYKQDLFTVEISQLNDENRFVLLTSILRDA